MSRHKLGDLASPPPAIVGTGLIALDVIVAGTDSNAVQLRAGGSCGNVLSMLAMLGWRSFPIGRLGADKAATLIVEDLNKEGMCTDYLIRETGVHTPVILEKVRPGGIPARTHSYSFRCPSCGSFFPRYRPIRKDTARDVTKALNLASVFYFDRTSPAALVLASHYRAKGSLVVFEPSSIGDERLFQKAVQSAHILKYSKERVADIADSVGEFVVPLEIETLGPDGLRYRRFRSKRGEWIEVPACKVSNLIDEAGSGDWCTAGLVHALGQNGELSFLRSSDRALQQALVWGQALAAINCSYAGARGVMDCISRDELLTLASSVAMGQCLESNGRSDLSPSVYDLLREVCSQCLTERPELVR